MVSVICPPCTPPNPGRADRSETTASNPPRAQRASGTGRISVKTDKAGRTKLDRLYQQGCAKIRLPKIYGSNALEAVLINSSGGLTGGDVMDWHLATSPNAHLVSTTQACEKLYKSQEGTARITNRIEIAENARVDWLPQETILFDRSGLDRTLFVDMAPSARFLAVEAVLLGRLAMGESVHQLCFKDQWRIRRGGKLIHAEALHLEGDAMAIGARNAVLKGHCALASICYVGPEDKETFDHFSAAMRALLPDHPNCSAGISAFGGKLIARLTAPDGLALRKLLLPLISVLRAGEPLPRVWTT